MEEDTSVADSVSCQLHANMRIEHDTHVDKKVKINSEVVILHIDI